jgi:aryl-alcohol dehydrogenase-like predicted oxidoreductase
MSLVFPGGMPRIIVGTSRMGSVFPNPLLAASDREREYELLDDMEELGCTAFDLAASYQAGGTERFIGGWIASRRNRDRLFLISKGGHPYPIVRPHRIDSGALSADLHASLRRLRTECIDLYLLHKDDETAPIEPILETMTTFQRQGKVGAWGVSNWRHPRIRALAALARSAGLPSLAASSPHFSLLEWVKPPWRGSVSIAGEANREARAYYVTEQLPVLAWSPLGSGFFSPHRSGMAGWRTRRAYGSPSNAARKERAGALARKYACSPAQIALAYLYHQPFPVFAVVAASTAQHMKSNLEAATLRLSAGDIRWLESGEGMLPS